MRNKIIFGAAAAGIIAGLIGAYLFGRQRSAQPPVFTPVENPFVTAIYANGIVESDQASGSNVNVYPEVSGRITAVLVHEGQTVTAGTPLVTIDSTIQRAATDQAHAQAAAALALLKELKAQPRRETLQIADSQVALAEANLKAARDQYDKRRATFDLDPHSLSKDVLDTAADAVAQNQASLDVARRQYALTRAGAWSYDIENQQRQYESAQQAYLSANALLSRFTVDARSDGVVLRLNVAVGTSVSATGTYDSYTQAQDPILIMGPPQQFMSVRCFVDEILVSRLPSPEHIRGQMQIRGTDLKVPLEFVSVQPFVSPKIQLSAERQEQVDVRVLPVIFRFPKKDSPVYPGQDVDVYIGTN